MSFVPPIRSNGFLEPKVPIASPKGRALKKSDSLFFPQFDDNTVKSLQLAQEVNQAENTLAHLDSAKKGETAIFSIVGLPIHHISMAQERLINPLRLLEEAGIGVDDNLESVANLALNMELVLRTFRGIGVGALLIFKKNYLSEAKHFLKLLQEKSKQMPPETDQAKQMALYLTKLDDKIKHEELALNQAAIKYGVTVGGYLPTVVSAIWNMVTATSPAVSASIGSVGMAASIGISYYDKYKAEHALELHSKWTKDLEALANKHTRSIPDKLDETLEKRKALKTHLKELTLEKHKSLDDYLRHDSVIKKAKFYANTFLSLAIIASMIAGAIVSIGLFALFPQVALLVVTIGFMATGIYYWATNRPNLFVELILTCVKSLYYSIGHAIDAWRLQKAKVELLELASQRVQAFAKNLKEGKKVNVEEVEKFNEEHSAIKKRVETLEKDVKYWTKRQEEIHVRILNAELADMNLLHARKGMDVKSLVEDIKALFNHLTDKDKAELKEVVGLDLTKLEKVPTDEALQEQLLKSYLGVHGDEHIKELKTKHELHVLYPTHKEAV